MKAEIICGTSIIKLGDCPVFSIVREIYVDGTESSFAKMVVGKSQYYNGLIPIVYPDGSGGRKDPNMKVKIVGYLKWDT